MARLETDDDLIAARNAELLNKTLMPGDIPAYNADGEQLPPKEKAYMCMMCHKSPPLEDDDYCAECREKLDLGPEQWDLMKQDVIQRNVTTAIVVVLVVLLVSAVIGTTVWRHRAAEAYAPAPPALKYAPVPPQPAGQPQIGPAPGQAAQSTPPPPNPGTGPGPAAVISPTQPGQPSPPTAQPQGPPPPPS
jgi:hypothetical protein